MFVVQQTVWVEILLEMLQETLVKRGRNLQNLLLR